MRLIKNTTELIGIKDPNIIISLVFETDTHMPEKSCSSAFTISLQLAIPILAISQISMRNEKDNRRQLQLSLIGLPLYIALIGQCIIL